MSVFSSNLFPLSSAFATIYQRKDHIRCLLKALREVSSDYDNATVMGDIMCDITERATKKRKAKKAKKEKAKKEEAKKEEAKKAEAKKAEKAKKEKKKKEEAKKAEAKKAEKWEKTVSFLTWLVDNGGCESSREWMSGENW